MRISDWFWIQFKSKPGDAAYWLSYRAHIWWNFWKFWQWIEVHIIYRKTNVHAIRCMSREKKNRRG